MTSRSTFCHVRIVTPDLPRSPSRVYEWSGTGGELGGLLSMQVQTSVQSFVNRFSMSFAPDGIGTPASWARRIPSYSLVFVEMGSSDRDGDDPTVMVGLTEPGVETEAWHGGRPQRSVTIPGRGIETVLEDARIYYSPFLEVHRARLSETLNRETNARLWEMLTGQLVWARQIWAKNIDPREALLRILIYWLANHENAVVNLRLPAPHIIRDLLLPGEWTAERMTRAVANVKIDRGDGSSGGEKWDFARFPGLARPPSWWSLVDETLRLPTAAMSPTGGSVLDLMRQVVDEQFHELFVRYDRGRARIIHRTRPFGQDVEQAKPGQTLFASDVPTLSTIQITSADVLASKGQWGMGPIHNLFHVTPGQGSVLDHEVYKAFSEPVFSGDEQDHAYIGRFGLRPLEHASPYFVIGQGEVLDNEVLGRMSTKLANVLRAWYDPHPAMWQGSLSVLGRAEHRAGQRLVWRGVDAQGQPDGRLLRETYVDEAVQHYDFRSGAFVSHLQVSRGWEVAEQTAV